MSSRSNVPTVLASLAVGAATLLFGAALVRAVTVDVEDVRPLPVEVEPTVAAPPSRAPPEPVPAVWEDGFQAAPEARETLLAAVEVDPFRPERRAPDSRYRLPGEPEPMARRPEPEREPPETPALRVVGAAVIGRGGAALIQAHAGGPPRLLSVGESVMGYTLASVDGESATLVGEAGRLRFPVTTAEVDRDDDDGRDRRRRGDDDDDRRREQLIERERMMRMRALMQQIQAAQRRGNRGGGGGP